MEIITKWTHVGKHSIGIERASCNLFYLINSFLVAKGNHYPDSKCRLVLPNIWTLCKWNHLICIIFVSIFSHGTTSSSSSSSFFFVLQFSDHLLSSLFHWKFFQSRIYALIFKKKNLCSKNQKTDNGGETY